MKRAKKFLIVIVLIVISVLILGFIDFRPLFRKPQNETIVKPIDETRKYYDIGSCYNMKEDLCYLVIYLNDEESSWTEKGKTSFIRNKFEPSLEFLQNNALKYEITLDDTYKTYPDKDNNPITYDGIIETEVVVNGGQEDILIQVAQSMGYNSPKEMNETLQEELDAKQIAYLIVVNKQGRSYKYAHVETNTERYEYCVFFAKSIGYDGKSCYSTIAHEILHLFGAEDYYDPYGDYPEREKLAKMLYPKDIMFSTVTNINTAEVGEYTAYTVGWIDKLPEECNVPEWWK